MVRIFVVRSGDGVFSSRVRPPSRKNHVFAAHGTKSRLDPPRNGIRWSRPKVLCMHGFAQPRNPSRGSSSHRPRCWNRAFLNPLPLFDVQESNFSGHCSNGRRECFDHLVPSEPKEPPRSIPTDEREEVVCPWKGVLLGSFSRVKSSTSIVRLRFRLHRTKQGTKRTPLRGIVHVLPPGETKLPSSTRTMQIKRSTGTGRASALERVWIERRARIETTQYSRCQPIDLVLILLLVECWIPLDLNIS